MDNTTHSNNYQKELKELEGLILQIKHELNAVNKYRLENEELREEVKHLTGLVGYYKEQLQLAKIDRKANTERKDDNA